MEICSLEKCTGCCSCENKCPKSCIRMEYDQNGFLRPHIEESECIKCLLCVKVCPSNKETELEGKDSKAYKAWSNDLNTRKNSSSGGIFSELAKEVLTQGGIVFGAAFNEKFKLQHIDINNLSELSKLRGSKYIQSDTSRSYKKVLDYLNKGKLVLYSGTPCQIDGLNHYLNKKYDNLITVDVLCHGAGSTKVFNDSIEYLSRQYNSIPKYIQFRYKRKSYSESDFRITFNNNKVFSKVLYISPYGYLFAKRLIVRQSCLNCKYSTRVRVSDITLGDYQNSDTRYQSKNEKKNGVSIVLANSIVGEEILNRIRNNIFCESVSFEETVKCCSTLKRENSYNEKNFIKFFEDYNSKSFLEIIKKDYKAPFMVKFQYFIGRDRYINLVNHVKSIIRR